jgi:hypothetical protein
MDEELSRASSTIGLSVKRDDFLTSGERSRNAIKVTDKPLKTASNRTLRLPKSELFSLKYRMPAKTVPASKHTSKNHDGYEVISENPTRSKGLNNLSPQRSQNFRLHRKLPRSNQKSRVTTY